MPSAITAHITGTVWKIEKRVSDKVADGERRVILESTETEMRGGWRAAGLATGLAVLLAGAGCSLETAGSGEACTRSSQCASGLACVDGECSQNIDAIGEQSTVPMLVPEEPDAAADAALTDAAPTDAGMTDAALPMGAAGSGGTGGAAGAGGVGGADASTTDAGPGQSDAATTPPGDASTDGG
jgi:hypothetical protein